MAILEMKHISKAFSGVYANEDIDLAVEKGEIHALLGENGAGKTTLMNILFGIYTADTGEIYWKDKKVRFVSPKDAIDQGIGMVHQHFSLVQKMTVLQNIILGLKQDGIFISKMEARARIVELADKYGLKVRPDARIRDLSVGEQQRVEILKALYRDVDLLILDEPTGGLDPLMQREFFEILKERNQEGTTVFLSSHVLSEVQRNCTKAAIIRDGKIIACDSVEVLSKTSAKRITVHGIVNIEQLGGIRDKKITEDSVSFLYSGDMSSLLRTLSSGQVNDLTVTEPDLEEVFLHYYEKDGETV